MSTNFDRLLLNESPDAVVATTIEGQVLYWSRGAETIFGYTGGEAVGRPLNDLIVPADRAKEEQETLQEAVRAGFATYETLRRRKDGALMNVDISSKAVRDERGEVEFILSSNKDVTQLRLRRDAKLVELRFRDLLESTPHGIVLVNPTGRIVHTNAQAQRLFRYERGELLGQLVEVLLPERFRAAHVGHRTKYFAQPRVRALEAGLDLYGRRKDGAEFPVEISLSPIEGDEGTLVMCAIRDMTERRRIECALQAKNMELEAAISELEAFSYSISHDLRAPVRAMGGFARMVCEEYAGQLPAEGQRQLGRIVENAAKMGELIDGLLAFSRVSRQPLNKRSVSPTAIVRQVAEELQSDQTDRRVQLSVAELPRCQADSTLIRQVYANLLSNAFKYTRQKDPAVIEVASFEEREGPVYYVKDNGAGFDMEYAGKLFGVFQRLHREEEFEGTGVGLAIVQRIIHRHGGRVWAKAEPGKGATFYFTLGETLSNA